MDFLLQRFATVPDRVAFAADDRDFTYGEIIAHTKRFQDRLAAEGVRPGEVVIILGDYSPELFCFLLALARNGNVLVPVTRETVVERETILALSEASWEADFSGQHEVAFKRLGGGATSPLLRRLAQGGHPGLLLFSSGSTGKPKAILHDLQLVAEKFRRQGPPVVAIAFLMLDHFGGINTILAITSGLGTVVTVADRSVAGICRTIERKRVALLPTTPSFLNLLVRSDLSSQFDLKSLRRITYGTEVMPQHTLDRVRELFPEVELQQTYGLSEVGVLRSRSRDDGSLWVSVGGKGFETRVVDGILWIRSAFAMLGYLNAPDPFDADGWFNTQDRVEVDGEWLRILGRDTDLINVGGQKVYPAEIEDAILGLVNVKDVAVYGERNALVGQIIVAKVVTERPEPVDALRAQIRRACAEKLAPFKVPAKVVLATGELHTARMKKARSGDPGT